jgi:hypothetical protein
MRIQKAYFILLFLTSCASNGIWYKEGSSLDEYNKVRYTCLKESQQPQSYAYGKADLNSVNGGAYYNSSSSMKTNYTLFDSCMNSHGFYWKKLDNE